MSDPVSFIKKRLDSVLRHNLIKAGANQPKEKEVSNGKFQRSKFRSKFRSFSESWYFLKVGEEKVHQNRLSYSPKEDAAFATHVYFCRKKQRNFIYPSCFP